MLKKLLFVLTALVAFQSGEGQAVAFASENGSSGNHTFPQFVDGRFPNGTFYTSTLIMSNPSETHTASCTIIFRGFRPTVQDSLDNVTSADAFTMDIDAGQADILTTSGVAEFRSGYVTIGCDQFIDAVVLYALHAPSKATLSEAVVLSSAQGTLSQLVVDGRNGARLGVALNNDSDVPVTVRVSARGYSQSLNSNQTLTVSPRSTVSHFIDELVTLPPDFIGQVFFESANQKITVMGLRFAGTAFTTIPASVRLP